jgi:hypothetical protein
MALRWRSSARTVRPHRCTFPLSLTHTPCFQLTSCRDPLRLCLFLLDQCLKRGVHLHQPARAVSVLKDENNLLKGIRISENEVETERMFLSIYSTEHN